MNIPIKVRTALACFCTMGASLFRAHAAEPGAEIVAPHHHVAPHGGTPVELGDEQYHLELNRDPATGTLTAYVLDGEMENFVRIAAHSIDMVAAVGDAHQTLKLMPIANSATGETIGDTSQFEAVADWLRNTTEFEAVLPALDVKGNLFSNVAFRFPTGRDHGGMAVDRTKKEHQPHVSPRGGTLVEVGAHKYNVDLLLDSTTGTMHAFLLNAHAKGVADIARVGMPSFVANVTIDGTPRVLTFVALANTATGEKPGDTSVFDAHADWLRQTNQFEGVFPQLVFRDVTFTDTAFNFPKGRTRK